MEFALHIAEALEEAEQEVEMELALTERPTLEAVVVVVLIPQLTSAAVLEDLE
jgi:hypothetical protein